MEEIAGFFLVILAALGLIFLAVVSGTLSGAVAGWIVGLFFGDTILGIFGQMGIHDVTMWQIGAFLGFTGAFFRKTSNIQKKKDR